VADYTAHLYCDTYPYVTPAELISCSKEAEGMEEDDPRILDAIDDASLIMFYLTGKQFAGVCETTVRPPCHAGGCRCGCSPFQVDLGFWPVTALTSVRYEGVTYTGTDLTDVFHVNDYRFIARNDGEPFVSGNQWAIAGGTEDSSANGYVFEVTLTHGLQVPRLLTRATRSLAGQFVAACCGKPCKLPERVTAVTRSGISMDVASATDLLRDGRTGIYEVDLAIQVFNPSKLQSPSFLFMPQKGYGRKINT
jgi:hypothetical protein